jgi:hypothetical protein
VRDLLAASWARDPLTETPRLLYEKEASKEARKTLLPHKIASMCNHGEHIESELLWSIVMSDLHDKGLVSKLRN